MASYVLIGDLEDCQGAKDNAPQQQFATQGTPIPNAGAPETTAGRWGFLRGHEDGSQTAGIVISSSHDATARKRIAIGPRASPFLPLMRCGPSRPGRPVQ